MDPTGPCRTIQNHKWPERTRKSHKGPHNASPSLPCVGLSHCPALHCRSCFTTENNDLPSLPVLDCHTVEHHTIAPALLQYTSLYPACLCWTVALLNIALLLLHYYRTLLFYPTCQCWTVALSNIALWLMSYDRKQCFTQPACVRLSHCWTSHCCSCITTEHIALPSLSVLDCRTVKHCTVAPALLQYTMFYPACLCWTVAMLHCRFCLTTVHNA